MRNDEHGELTGDIVDDRVLLSIDELSRLCAVDLQYVVELVEEGVLEVATVEIVRSDVSQWRFRGSALRRARTALRLQRDLELNLPGVALALELLEELTALRRRYGVEER